MNDDMDIEELPLEDALKLDEVAWLLWLDARQDDNFEYQREHEDE